MLSEDEDEQVYDLATLYPGLAPSDVDAPAFMRAQPVLLRMDEAELAEVTEFSFFNRERV